MRSILFTFAISLLGVGLFWALDLPLPWLLGPMFACLLAALLGVRMKGPYGLTQVMRTVLGVAVGATITPELMSVLPGLAGSLLLMPVLVVVMGAIGYPFFRRVAGFDHPTAFYCAMPGGLQDMLIFGEEAGGDVRALSLVHATRVLIIVSGLPVLFAAVLGVDLHNPPGAPAADLPLYELAIMAGAGIVGWKLGEAVGLFGASILGPMFLTAALSLGGVIEHRPPAEAIWAA